jgi:hypothetical protein
MASRDQGTLLVCFLSGNRRLQQFERDWLDQIGKQRRGRFRMVVGGGEISGTGSFAENDLPFTAESAARQ